MATSEVTLLFKGDPRSLKAAAAEVRTALSSTQKQTQDYRQSLDRLSTSMSALPGPIGNVASRLSSLSSVFAGLTSTTGALTLGLGALAAGAIGAGVALFKLTQQAAEFQGKMFDLSQQVGVSVETLSALEIAAENTGGSIESVTQAVFQFQRQMEDALDPTSKQAKLFSELGIQTDNTEQALRQAFAALARMPEGFRQTSAAAELFGARGGKQVLAIIKEMKGDLPGAIRELERMGILIGGPAAQAADQFNDRLNTLQFQLRGLVGLVGNQLMPQISSAIKTFSDLLANNQQVINQWAQAIGDAARGAFALGSAVAALGGQISGLGNIPIPRILQILMSIGGFSGIATGLQTLGSTQGGQLDRGTSRTILGQMNALRTPGFSGGFGNPFSLPRPAPRGRTGGGSGGGGRARTTEEPVIGFLGRLSEGFSREAFDKQTDALQKLQGFLIDHEEAIRGITLAERSYLAVTQDFIESLEKQGFKFDEVTKKTLLYDAAMIRAFKTLSDFIPAFEKHAESLAAPGREGGVGSTEDQIARAAGAAADAAAGTPPPGLVESVGLFEEFSNLMGETFGVGAEQAQVFGDILASTFGRVAEGVGAAVKAFVLFGSAQGSFKKFAAEVIASVAQMSAVQAVFELAQGLAMLALNFFFPNPKYAASAAAHFKAAAIFGAIALVTAGVGRAVAGNSFNEEGSVAHGGGGSSTPPQDRTIREGRGGRGAQPMVMGVMEVNVKHDDGFVERQIVKIYNKNGEARNTFRRDMLGEQNA